MECARLKHWNFWCSRRFPPPDWIWMVATQVTDTPFVLDFLENPYILKKRGILILETRQYYSSREYKV